MSTKLILHMGMPKTGTSALQVLFAKNRDVLEKYGVIYPNSKFDGQAVNEKITSGNGVELAKFFNPNLPHHGNFSNYLNVLEKILKSNAGKTILFSSEFLSLARGDRYNQLIDLMTKHDVELTCVFYVRSVVGHAISAYSQYIKRHKYSQTFNHFIKHDLNYAFWTLNNALEKGHNKVVIRNYDEAKKNIYYDFLLNVLNLKEVNDFELPAKAVNRSLSKEELKILRQLNRNFTNNKQSTVISDYFIYNNPDKKTEKEISVEDLSYLESLYSEQIKSINEIDPTLNLKIKSDDVEISYNKEQELTENEELLANTIASLMADTPDKAAVKLAKEEEYLYNLNILNDNVIAGWAWNKSSLRPVVVHLEYDGQDVLALPAERFRLDLQEKKIGNGYHAFRLQIGGFFSDKSKIKLFFKNSKNQKIYFKK